MRGVFVAGTDTDAGKTIVAAALVAALGARYWKPVQSGLRDLPGGDSAEVARLTGRDPGDFPPPAYAFQAPLAPDQAAALEGARIDPGRIVLPGEGLVVEGAGGLLVPLDGATLMIDLARRLGLPVVLAARTGLGTINHTLLTVRQARSMGLTVTGVVLNDLAGGRHGLAEKTNVQEIPDLCGAPLLGVVPHGKSGCTTAVRRLCDRIFRGDLT